MPPIPFFLRNSSTNLERIIYCLNYHYSPILHAEQFFPSGGALNATFYPVNHVVYNHQA